MNEEQQEIFELQENIINLLKTPEENIFSILDKKSLNLTGEQIKILLFLKSFENEIIDNFIKNYLEFKTYNQAYKIIIEALKYYSLIDLVRGKVRLNLQQQK